MNSKRIITFVAICTIGLGILLHATKSSSASWTDPVSGVEFIWIDGGCYQMGMTAAEEAELRARVPERFYSKRFADEPQRQACPQGFWLSRMEITQAQWAAVTGEQEKACYASRAPGNPVNWVSLEEAQAFTRQLNAQHNGTERFALPTEEQWEKACRDQTRGDLGLTGMLGQPEEWVDTFYTENGTAPIVEDPRDPRVLKGDRCTGRRPAVAQHVHCDVSFRLVRLAPQGSTSQQPPQ
ncbi:formylglycine-generating enzyme family protein [Megalodesulfovibrio paquesii]